MRVRPSRGGPGSTPVPSDSVRREQTLHVGHPDDLGCSDCIYPAGPMKVVICGSREWNDSARVAEIVCGLRERFGSDVVIVHGGCRGPDMFAEGAALAEGIETRVYRPDWSRGRRGGPERNVRMLQEEKPDVVIAFHLNGSRGTAHTIGEAKRRGIPVEVYS